MKYQHGGKQPLGWGTGRTDIIRQSDWNSHGPRTHTLGGKITEDSFNILVPVFIVGIAIILLSLIPA